MKFWFFFLPEKSWILEYNWDPNFFLRTQTRLGIFGKDFSKKNTRTRGEPKVNRCLLSTDFGPDPESCFFKNWTQNRIRGSILLLTITGNTLSYLFRTGTHPEVLVGSTVLMPTITVCRQITRFLCARECKEIVVRFLSLLCKFIVSCLWSSSRVRSIVYTFLPRNTASPVGQTVAPLDSNRFYQGLFQSVTSFHSTVNSHFWRNIIYKKKLEPRGEPKVNREFIICLGPDQNCVWFLEVEPESEPGFCFEPRGSCSVPPSWCWRSLFADSLGVSFCARKCNEIAVPFPSLLCNSSSSAFRAPLMCVHSSYIYTSSIYITEHGRADQNSASRSNLVFLLEI